MVNRVLVLLLAAAMVVPAWGQTETSEEAEEVKAALVALWDAIEKGDLERYASFLHPDYTVFSASGVYLTAGKELAMRNVADFLRRAKNARTEMHQPQVTVRGKVAWIVYHWTERAEVDGKRVSRQGKSTRIYVKEGGRWLCTHAHFTAVP
jgi:ketosteroid isomerase-like protein